MSDFRGFIDAIERGDLDAVRRLWKAQYANEKYAEGGRSALHYASQSNERGDIVRFLLDKGADIEGADSLGWRPIHCAAFDGMTRVMRVLVDARADINVVSEDGKTALDLAVMRSNRDCAKILRATMLFSNCAGNFRRPSEKSSTSKALKKTSDTKKDGVCAVCAVCASGASGAAGICPICDDEKINRVLPCGHRFCTTCVDKTTRCFLCCREFGYTNISRF